jgi:hypothetical protein
MVVQDQTAAALLCQDFALHFLAPFVARDCTTAQAAGELKVSAQRMSYWTGKLLQCGLIRQVAVRASGRHRSAVYRSTDDEFFVPFTLLTQHDALLMLKSLQGRQFERLQHSLARTATRKNRNFGLRIWRVPQGVVLNTQHAKDADADLGFVSNFYALWLTTEERDALRHDLLALMAKYHGLSAKASKRKRVLLYTAMVDDPIDMLSS